MARGCGGVAAAAARIRLGGGCVSAGKLCRLPKTMRGNNTLGKVLRK
jgi:hypothetical protein